MDPKGDKITLLLGEVESVRSLTADARLAAVDGLFDWFLGREVVRGGVGGETLDALVARQERHLAVCRARAAAGRKGGLVGGRATGAAKARFGNQNAKQNKAENAKQNKTQSKTQSKSDNVEEVTAISKECEVIPAETQSKTETRRENAKQNKTQSKTQSKTPPFAPFPLPPLVPPCTLTPYNPPSLVGSFESEGPTAPWREGARTRGAGDGARDGALAGEPPSAPQGRPPYLPDEDLQRCYASQIGVPLDYLPAFMAEMERNGWGYVNRGGVFVQLNRQNFKYVLGAFWRQRRRRDGKAAQPQGVSLDALEGFDFSRFGE